MSIKDRRRASYSNNEHSANRSSALVQIFDEGRSSNAYDGGVHDALATPLLRRPPLSSWILRGSWWPSHFASIVCFRALADFLRDIEMVLNTPSSILLSARGTIAPLRPAWSVDYCSVLEVLHLERPLGRNSICHQCRALKSAGASRDYRLSSFRWWHSPLSNWVSSYAVLDHLNYGLPLFEKSNWLRRDCDSERQRWAARRLAFSCLQKRWNVFVSLFCF